MCDPHLRIEEVNDTLNAAISFTVRNSTDSTWYALPDDYSFSFRLYYRDGVVYDGGSWGQVRLVGNSLSVSNVLPRQVAVEPRSEHAVSLFRQVDAMELPPEGQAKLVITYRCWSPYVKQNKRDVIVNEKLGPCDVTVQPVKCSTGMAVEIVTGRTNKKCCR